MDSYPNPLLGSIPGSATNLMNRTLSSLAAASIAAFFFSLTALVWIYGRPILIHANGAITRAEGVESKINASAVNLDAATKAWAGSAKTQADAVTGLVTDAHGTLSGVDGTLSALQGDAKAVQTSADALTGEIGALRATTDAARVNLEHLTPLEDKASSTIAKLGSTSDNINDILKRKAVGQILDNVAGMTLNANGILADGKTMADRATAPKKWYERLFGYASDTYDLAALAARHMN